MSINIPALSLLFVGFFGRALSAETQSLTVVFPFTVSYESVPIAVYDKAAGILYEIKASDSTVSATHSYFLPSDLTGSVVAFLIANGLSSWYENVSLPRTTPILYPDTISVLEVSISKGLVMKSIADLKEDLEVAVFRVTALGIDPFYYRSLPIVEKGNDKNISTRLVIDGPTPGGYIISVQGQQSKRPLFMKNIKLSENDIRHFHSKEERMDAPASKDAISVVMSALDKWMGFAGPVYHLSNANFKKIIFLDAAGHVTDVDDHR